MVKYEDLIDKSIRLKIKVASTRTRWIVIIPTVLLGQRLVLLKRKLSRFFLVSGVVFADRLS